MSFTVAIIGRPNVGKSTLFNRLVGKKLALVDDQPGVTRDRRAGDARLGDLNFTVIDTAGLEEGAVETLSGRMRAQTEAAIEDADAIFFIVDARVGVTPEDRHFASLARRAGKPLILIANKAEGKAGEAAPTTLSRSASAIRFRFPPNMATASPNFIPRCLPHCPKRRRSPRTRPNRSAGWSWRTTRTAANSIRQNLCASPSSGGPMPANRR
jgi:small GTP-binding protein